MPPGFRCKPGQCQSPRSTQASPRGKGPRQAGAKPPRRHGELEFSPRGAYLPLCPCADQGSPLMGLVWRVWLFGPQGSVPSLVRFIQVTLTLALCLAVLQPPPHPHEAPHLGLASWFPVLDLTLASFLHCTALAFGCRLLSDLYLPPASQNL